MKNFGYVCIIVFGIMVLAAGIKNNMLVGIDPRASYIVGCAFIGGGIAYIVTGIKLIKG